MRISKSRRSCGADATVLDRSDPRHCRVLAGEFYERGARVASVDRFRLCGSASGVPVKVVAQRIGHADVGVTLKVYAHVLPGDDEDAALRADSLLAP